MWKRLLVVVMAATLLGSVLPGGVVLAHAKLLRADPKPGSTVNARPQVVRVWFNDELDTKRSRISVWDSRGQRVDNGKGGVDLKDMDRKSMVVTLKSPAGPGTYRVMWKAVSLDDQFVARGSFRFTVARK